MRDVNTQGLKNVMKMLLQKEPIKLTCTEHVNSGGQLDGKAQAYTSS